jgi:hypothetical protein
MRAFGPRNPRDEIPAGELDLYPAFDWPDSGTSAIYPSSASDTKAISFTHPQLIQELAPAAGAPRIQTIIYIDQGTGSSDSVPISLDYQDSQSQIQTMEVVEGRLGTLKAWRLQVLQRSRLEPRQLTVFRVRGLNQTFGRVMKENSWSPSLMIAVCDGCAMGGNRRCENELSEEPEARGRSKHWPGIRWWITDHFRGQTVPKRLPPGACIPLEGEPSAFRFRKMARLSLTWGGYGNWSCIRGATLFRVEESGSALR